MINNMLFLYKLIKALQTPRAFSFASLRSKGNECTVESQGCIT